MVVEGINARTESDGIVLLQASIAFHLGCDRFLTL